jgi:hypothetical protein
MSGTCLNLTSWLEVHLASLFQSRVCVEDCKTSEATSPLSTAEFCKSLDPSGSCGKTSQASCHRQEDGTLVPSSGRWSNSGMGSLTEFLTLSTLEYPNDAVESSLLDVLETGPVPQKFFLSPTACEGILRRERKNRSRAGKLSEQLRLVLETLATTTVQKKATQ